MSEQTTVVWSDLRDDAIQAFESFPPAADEEALMAAFERNPTAVRRAFERTRDRFKSGQVRAPWRIWRLECETRSDVSVQVGPSRERMVAKAEMWIRKAGLFYPTWDEAHAALFVDGFADKGQTLAAWAKDGSLTDRLKALFDQERPRGLAIEADAEARAARYLEHRGAVKVDHDRAAALARIQAERTKEEAA